MRCISCDHRLSEVESTRRVASTGDFLDMCNKCYEPIRSDVPTINRTEEDVEDGFDEDDFIEEQEIDPWDDGAAEYIRGLPYQDEN